MDPNFSLVSFRFQDGLVRFWRRHPSMMAICLAAMISTPFVLGFLGAVMVGMGDLHSLLKLPLMFFSLVGIGFLTMIAHNAWGQPIPRGEQWGLVDRMGSEVIPTDRRLCRLEARLILRTQGEANQSHARAHNLAAKLPLPSPSACINKERL